MSSNNNPHEKAILNYMQSIIEAVASRKFGRDEAAQDCVVIFLEQAYLMPEAQQWPISQEEAGKIAAEAEHCAKAEVSRLRRLRRREPFYAEFDSGGLLCSATQPAYSSIGPEHRCILSHTIGLIGFAVRQLPPCQQSLFVSAVVKRQSHIEVAARTGRTRQSVDRSVRRLIAAIRRILESMDLTGEEISGLLNEIDRCRCPRALPRRPPA